jgi:N-acetylneuraminate epimerase
MKYVWGILFWVTFAWSINVVAADGWKWTPLPPIPDPEGFAGPFAGTLGLEKRLIVAGGANFPGQKPWEGGKKVWYDSIYSLQAGNQWEVIGKLPRPLGYGVSISVDGDVIGIGGSDAWQHYAGVFRISFTENRLSITELPALPAPCANLCGARLGRSIYVAGGIASPDAVEALNVTWALDLDHLEAGWQTLPPWPGPGRMLASAGAQDGSFFVVGGAGLRAAADGKPARVWLRDGYRYTPGKGWQPIADLPQIAVAAPSPMPAVGASTLLLIGGDDGTQVATEPRDHRGFPRTIFAYDTVKNTWQPVGEIPLGLVTTTTVEWKDGFLIPGGENRPGIRSTEVWVASPQNTATTK